MAGRILVAGPGHDHLLAFLQRYSSSLRRYLLSKRRHFVTANVARQWRNETPPGGLTELYVYRPETARVWPDPVLGILSPLDPGCNLPGNVGCWTCKTLVPDEGGAGNTVAVADLFTRHTVREHQAQILHSACDYIQHTGPDAETEVCCGILEAFPELDGMRQMHCRMHDAPVLLRKEMQGLFAGRDIVTKGNLSVLTMARKTTNDMTGWSRDVEREREVLAEQFVTAAKEICGRLRGEGFWSDFIDPNSGTPYYHSHSNTTMFETDEKYRLLGFRVEDLGCCKVITHKDFGRNVFVGTIFTDASTATGVVQDMFEEMQFILEEKLGVVPPQPHAQEDNTAHAVCSQNDAAGKV